MPRKTVHVYTVTQQLLVGAKSYQRYRRIFLDVIDLTSFAIRALVSYREIKQSAVNNDGTLKDKICQKISLSNMSKCMLNVFCVTCV